MTFDLSLSETAGAGSLQRLVSATQSPSLKISGPARSAKTQWRPAMSFRGEGTRQPRETHEKKSASTFARLPSFRIQQRQRRIESVSVLSVGSCSNPKRCSPHRVGLERSPAQAPLRTVRESFPSHGSSLSMDTSRCGVPQLGKHAATNASRLIQPLPYLSTAELLGNPYAGPETHQSTGVDRHLLFSVRTVPSMF